MDALGVVLLLFFIGTVGVSIGILTSSHNSRIIAAWLLARAQAQDERRTAYQAIEEERRKYQKELEHRFNGKSEIKTRIAD